jgi:cyclic beta-1,2-glucan synthetase
VIALLRRWHALRTPATPWNSGELIRAELFSVERLEVHAASLALAQPVAVRHIARRSLGARLRENESALLAAYRGMASTVAQGRVITPAAEWLLDNYHLVEDQIREIRQDLPPSYYRRLPKLASGPLLGYPRVFGLAWAFIAHTDSRFDPEVLRRFVRAYQRIQPLTIGELWAVAITLRIVLVENLRRAAVQMVSNRDARQEADAVADRLLGVNGLSGEPDVLSHLKPPGVDVLPSFVVQLAQRLRDQDPRVTPALQWLEHHFSSKGENAEQIARDELQRQGASNVTVRNIIASMRLLSDLDWAEFFENVSLVDDSLRKGSDFAEMDFASRNLYRSAIEELAHGSVRPELDVAQAALRAARSRDRGSDDHAIGDADRAADPGFHLIGSGRATFEIQIGYRRAFWARLGHWIVVNGVRHYIVSILLFAAIVLASLLLGLRARGIELRPMLWLAALGFLPALELAVALVNRGVVQGRGPRALPGLALRAGVPDTLRTLVAVPILLTSREAVEMQIEGLEVRHLASPDGELYFALLTDWLDAPQEYVDGDDELLQAAVAGIALLNARHEPGPAGKRFLLFHRRRVWSADQRLWIGWERKRGKLHELNRLLRGAGDTTFVDLAGQRLAVPADVRYVITLDADTRLPRGTARRLVGKMAHPLNRPRFDAASGQVLDGYAVLQPRVTPSLPSDLEASRFQQIFSSGGGIDPYATAVSDVYQDLIGEGSYAGKGIYDIDAFEAALTGRVADGTLLSHDLFEGIFARAGLVSDIQVVEDYPARYDVAAARQHRWVRGDWQLLPWILGRRDAGAASSGRGNARISLIGRWKMLDNLRRSLTAPANVAALICGWFLPRSAALLWTGFILVTIAVPAWLPVLAAVLPRNDGASLRSHFRALRQDMRMAATQTAFLLTFQAHLAWLMCDAIARTLFRLLVTQRNLLQWVTAAQLSLGSRFKLTRAYWQMGGTVAIAGLAGFAVASLKPDNWWLAAPVVALWAASPALAVWISRAPRAAGGTPVLEPEVHALRHIARRTWRYFETFVTAEDNMLPPDNFQEDPQPVVAHRTSPTNVGLYLLACVSAKDFGWLGTLETVERIEATLATLQRMPRYRGHFFNWYDTRDLRPLEPRYVSTVDSGNLAAHLIAMANACREWAAASPSIFPALSGARDAVELSLEALLAVPADQRTQHVGRVQLEAALASLRVTLAGQLPPTATVMTATVVDMARALAGELAPGAGRDLIYWAEAAQRSLASAQRDLDLTPSQLDALAERLMTIDASARAMAMAMKFDFLVDPDRRLLSIGYRPADGSLDPSCYDLLASEARLASFVAIAKNDVPAQHWFRLGRAVTAVEHGAALVSWSGSMFEYLMPALVMRAPAGSLLDQTNRLIVRRQISYGDELGIPWGISESAFNARDIELTYQYSNFGVPGLGLKRGLSEDTVIAPYATALAAMVDPALAVANFRRLETVGALGRYGYYEALDYTRSRLPEGSRIAIVRAYMAHHQGMTIAAIANVLHDGRMRERFHAEAMIQATELLLQERTPREVPIVQLRAGEVTSTARISDGMAPVERRLRTPHDVTPQTHLLSNGRYAVMLTAAGSGYSRWRDVSITRWREDATRDDFGNYVILRDVDSGAVWSSGYQPCGVEADRYEVAFTEDRAEYRRIDGNLTTTLEVLVSPEDDAEVRRVTLSNSGNWARDIDVTSYSELVLAPAAADLAHPAFSKLFVQTEFVEKSGALLATRRRRTAEEPEVWAAHHAVIEGECLRPVEYETDRARFLGRGRELRDSIAVLDGRRLSNTVGTVLDPVFALRYRVRVPPGGAVRIALWTSVAATRAGLLEVLDRHREANAFVRTGTLTWTQGQVQLRHLGIDTAEANLFQRLAGHMLFANAAMRPASATINRGAGGPEGLWAVGISGDLPIVLLRIDNVDDIDIARQLLRAQEYWRLKQLAVDLVIINERATTYVQDLQDALETQHRMSQSRPQLGGDSTRSGVFILRSDLISDQTRALLVSVARVVLAGQRGSLAAQLDRYREGAGQAPRVFARQMQEAIPPTSAPPANLEFFNGLGGFAADGREYCTLLGPTQTTPVPWINVIANPHFGFHVAVEGSGFTWSLNSRENQLTPWSNDPVTDRAGEALYLRDEESGELWGPTAAPIRTPGATYAASHGQGYSRFEHTSRGIALELLMFVPLTDSIKISRLRIHNTSASARRLSVTAYAECVLGTSRSATAPYIVTAVDTGSGALLARNPWRTQSAERVGFMDLGGRQAAWTCDRREFIGRHGTLAKPAALVSLKPLSKRVGAGLDPCWALQTFIDLEPDETTEVVWLMGDAANLVEAQALIARYRSADLDDIYLQVLAHWDEVLGTFQVKTPDRSMDLMLNRWLLYQTLACRFWARVGFYQASGAYGFRDQLQDGMALAVPQPQLTRAHLLRAAGRQFREGDVQHWWLPGSGQGVRTRISDDRVWLAYTTAHYVLATGDGAVLDEQIGFLEGQALLPEEHEVYFRPVQSDERASLFEHCALALDQSLAVGQHGLPLIGTGDWNDGFNRVGELGHGESIWLGWFLYATLTTFAPLARDRGELKRAERWLKHAAELRDALEAKGWDGQWYRRGYYDNGAPLGSAASEECRIDAIAQSWAVLSGAGDPTRARAAMAAVNSQLIDRDTGLALLFAPPFDHSAIDPGYVKAYPPGVRENGGQYTHGALWSIMAFAALGQGNDAAELFSLLNPVNRARTRTDVHRYKVEPYVVAADVYSQHPHVGRGGWTWYTGSAGWMYRAGIESILGLRVQGASLHLAPCIPAHWPRVEVTYRYRTTRYEILIDNTSRAGHGIASIELDGTTLPAGQERIQRVDDGGVHQVRVLLGKP